MNSDDDYGHPNTPPDICEASKEVAEKLLPVKSNKTYRKSYDKFMAWREVKKVESFSQRVLLAYFDEMSKTLKPTTLWSEFSKLKTMIQYNHQIDINYPDLKRFLKNLEKNTANNTKKASTFSSNDIERFLNTAPDNEWLAIKVAAIFGFLGACRREELRNVTTDDLELYYPDGDREKKNPTLHVRIPKTKTYKRRSFTLEGKYYKIYKKYLEQRSAAAKGRKDFFLKYQNGKCSNQVIGINSFGEMPKKVARFLNLDRPDSYTGHAWRRTSATLLVEGGADMTTLKRHGGWRSDTVAEGYVESSRNEKRKIYSRITSSMNVKATSKSNSLTSPSASTTPVPTLTSTGPKFSETAVQDAPAQIVVPEDGLIQIQNCSNCTFQFINKKEDG